MKYFTEMVVLGGTIEQNIFCLAKYNMVTGQSATYIKTLLSPKIISKLQLAQAYPTLH